MTCLECNTQLSYLDHRRSMDQFGAELCDRHLHRMERLIRDHRVPAEAVILYYLLLENGTRAMLSWWDGKQTVDLALSRVKLNIEIDTGGRPLTHNQALHQLEETMHSFKNGFTCIRIPDYLIRNYRQDTLVYLQGIIGGLKSNLKVV